MLIMTTPKLCKGKGNVPNPYLDKTLLQSLSAVSSSIPMANKDKNDTNYASSSSLQSHKSEISVDDAMLNDTSFAEESISTLRLHEDSIITSLSHCDALLPVFEAFPGSARTSQTTRDGDGDSETKTSDSEFVEINVGGVKFQSTMDTLCKYPSSRLARDIRRGVTFFDRDGSVFDHILNWLRRGALLLSDSVHDHDAHIINQMLFESQYFGLIHLLDELIMLKLNSRVLSTSTSKSLQKQHLRQVRQLILEEYNLQKGSKKRYEFTQRWTSLFRYDVATFSSTSSPSAILQSVCAGARSLLILFVAQNQMFCIYYYKPWSDKAYRQKIGNNWLYWIGEHLHDNLHKNKFEPLSGKKFDCTYAHKGEIVASYKQTKEGAKVGKESKKDCSLGFQWATSNQHTLILSNLKGIFRSLLAADRKDQVQVSMLDVFHVAFDRK